MTTASWHDADGWMIVLITTSRGKDYSVGMCIEEGNDATKVSEIREHTPQGEGDRHFCDVLLGEDTLIRKFDVIEILYTGPKEKPPF